MQHRFARFLAICTVVAGLSAVCAGDRSGVATWTAVDASGPVHGRAAYARSDQWTRVRTGDSLAPLTAIRTGGRGGTTLVSGERTLVVGPESELELPALDVDARPAEALQDRGTIDYDLSGENSPSLDVVTPYMIAAADGATFRMTILNGTSVVDVFDGTVVVTSRLDGTTAILGAGEGATVDAETTAGLDLRPAGGNALAHNR